MKPLKQSTAATVLIGPAVDKDDGLTPETGLTSGTVDELVAWKDGAVAAVDISGTTTFTHRSGGDYTATLSADDTDTLGTLRIKVRDDSVCLPMWEEFSVLPANVYESLFGSDTIQVDVALWDNTAVETPDTAGHPKVTIKSGSGTGELDLTSGAVAIASINADAITAAAIATGAFTDDALAASFAEKLTDILVRRGYNSIRTSSHGDSVDFRSLLGAIARLVNKNDASSGTSLVVKHEDDVTTFETSGLTSDANADPITVVDPS